MKKAFEFIRLGKAKAIFDKLNKYIEKHKEDEFTDKYGEVRLVGNSVLLNWYKHYDGLSELGLPELWQNFYQQEIGSYDKLLMMKFMLASTGAPNEIEEDEDDEFDEEEQEDKEAAIQSLNTFEPIINKMYAGFTYRGLQKSLRKLTYYRQIEDIIDGLAHEYRNEATYQQFSVNMLLQLLPLLNTKNIFRQYTNKHTWLRDKQEYGAREIVYPIHNNKFVRFWLDAPQHPINDALFTRYFTVRYQLYKLTN